MAEVNQNSPGYNGGNNPRRAQAFLNVSVKAKDGSLHRFNKGIPLYDDQLIGRSLINGAKAHMAELEEALALAAEAEDAGEDVEGTIESFTVELSGTVQLVNDQTNAEDIQF